MKNLTCKAALTSCLLILSAQVFAKAPVYQCAVDSEVIDLTLNQRGTTKTGERVSIGRFQIKQIGDAEMAHAMSVRLALVEKGEVSQLFLYVNSYKSQQKKQTLGKDLSDLIQVQVPMKNQTRQMVSIQCQSLEKAQIDAEIIEGKIDAIAGQN